MKIKVLVLLKEVRKLLKKFVDENTVRKVPKNGYIVIDGKETGVSNLLTFLEENPEIAKKNGYYPVKEVEYPSLQEDEYVEEKYSIARGKIVPQYTVLSYDTDVTE